MRDEFEFRVLVEGLIGDRFEDRLGVGRKALIGVPDGTSFGQPIVAAWLVAADAIRATYRKAPQS